jgi:DNA helicase-2/ATP-dependent DNA helicase PcrA
VAAQTGYGMQTACVVVKEFESTEKQNQFLAEQILKHSKQGKFSDIAVLVRTNTGAQDFLQTFLQYKIPFTIKEHFLNPFEHWIAQDILAYIHLAMGSRERKYFFRIINRPVRYLSREAFADTVVDFERAKAFYAEKSALKDRVEQLEDDILILSKFSPFAAVNYIRKAIGYEDYIRQYADEKKQDKASLYEILDEISQSTKTCRTFPEWFEYIKAYTEQLQNKKPDNAGGDRGRNSMDSVTVSTMHASKGLEYKKVFLVGLNEGNVPYHKAVLEKELEEERRMFYVAMTRAKEELHLYFPRERAGKAQKISRFLQEIDRSSVVWELIEDK